MKAKALIAWLLILVFSACADGTDVRTYTQQAEAKLGLAMTNMAEVFRKQERIYMNLVNDFKVRAEKLRALPDTIDTQAKPNMLKKLKAQLYFEFLEQLSDYRFIFSKETLYMRVLPPPGYDSGTAPESVSDADYRRAYQELIQKNKQKAALSKLDYELQKIRTTATTDAVNFVNLTFPPTAESAKELRSLLDSIHNTDLKAELTTAFKMILTVK